MAEGAASPTARLQLRALLLFISTAAVLCQGISSELLGAKKVSCDTNNNKAALFVFGDSLYDPGNNNYISTTNTDFQANFWPYGESFFSQPTGRFCDGRLIPDFICKITLNFYINILTHLCRHPKLYKFNYLLGEYAGLPLIPPYLQPGKHQFVYGANFASGGAGALDETYPGLVNFVSKIKCTN